MLIISRIIYSVITLYMVAILLRWASPVLMIELEVGRMAWLKKITEPALQIMRKVISPIGPFDFSPIAAVFVLWFLRTLILRIMTIA